MNISAQDYNQEIKSLAYSLVQEELHNIKVMSSRISQEEAIEAAQEYINDTVIHEK